MYKILLVEDDNDISEANQAYLKKLGYEVYIAESGSSAMEFIRKYDFDCIILDVLLPDISGFDLLPQIRQDSKSPVIFLTCRDEEDDRVHGLMAGADDYMVKPHGMKELAARIYNVVRRTSVATGNISMDDSNKTVFSENAAVQLSATEYALFKLLYENKGTPVTTAEIHSRLWSEDNATDVNSVAVYIKRLREKLAPFEKNLGLIKNIYKRGYVIDSSQDGD